MNRPLNDGERTYDLTDSLFEQYELLANCVKERHLFTFEEMLVEWLYLPHEYLSIVDVLGDDCELILTINGEEKTFLPSDIKDIIFLKDCQKIADILKENTNTELVNTIKDNFHYLSYSLNDFDETLKERTNTLIGKVLYENNYLFVEFQKLCTEQTLLTFSKEYSDK